jgi:predicted acylesterase/phospholipase RssA
VLDGSDHALLGRLSTTSLRREIAHAEREGVMDPGPANFLAISGGGENGAYGAGLLTAWSDLGTRPVFKFVTGVSTGALMAPFAFLGPAYDRRLEHFYTEIGKSDVMASRGIMAAAFGDSLYDSSPLLRTIRAELTPDLVAAIGHEYLEKGRVLVVATTNLDIPAAVLWDIGAIAASGSPQSAELIARILLASASIPGVFPPVMIDLEADGEHFQEMNVDGGTMAQVVFYPPSLGATDLIHAGLPAGGRVRKLLDSRKRHLYVIRNSRPGADFETVDRSTLTIVNRAIATLISSQGIGDIYQLYLLAQRDGIDFSVAYIPESFTDKSPGPFDQAYMKKLYRFGRETMLKGTPWNKFPPGYNPTPIFRRLLASTAG